MAISFSQNLAVFLALGIAHATSAPPTCSGPPGECANPDMAELGDVGVLMQMKPKIAQEKVSTETAINSTSSANEINECDAVKLVPLAQMSALVYELHADTTIDKSYPELDAEGFQVAKQQQQPDFKAGGDFLPAFAVWTRESPCKQAVLAIKGTDLGSLTDITADLKSIVGGVEPTAAKKELKEAVDEYKGKGYSVLVTGHSLGGYMGEIMSTTYNLPGAVFCAPGPDGPISTHNGEFKNAAFQNVNGDNEPIGNLAPGIFIHKQWSVYVSGNNDHSIVKMVDVLKTKSADITNANVLEYCESGWTGYYLNLLDGTNTSHLPGYRLP